MTQETEREAFEKWYVCPDDNKRALRRNGDGYALMQVNLSWSAWQARARVGKGEVERPESCEKLYSNPSGPWRNEDLPEGFRVQNRIFAADAKGKAVCTITCRSFAEADYYAKLIIAADGTALSAQAKPVEVGELAKLLSLYDGNYGWGHEEAAQAILNKYYVTEKV